MARRIYSAIASLDGYVAGDGVRVELELLDQRRFGRGVIYLRYQVGPPASTARSPS